MDNKCCQRTYSISSPHTHMYVHIHITDSRKPIIYDLKIDSSVLMARARQTHQFKWATTRLRTRAYSTLLPTGVWSPNCVPLIVHAYIN